MKQLLTTLCILLLGTASFAQPTTAMDFNRMDCNGNMRHLFTDLDSGKVVILEFFMGPNCTSCMDAAQEIEGMKTQLLASYPGKVMTYALGFQNSYTCATITTWVTSQGLTAIPMDSGATQVAYYGGFSMPTIVVVAGANHDIIYSANPNNGGYTPGDTSTMSTNIKNFFSPVSVESVPSPIASVQAYPNPANTEVHLTLQLNESSEISISMVDMTGRTVATVISDRVAAGEYHNSFDISRLASGSYFLKITANGTTSAQRINVVR
jgi:thiol-disulfide isomerase/thioredoxin